MYSPGPGVWLLYAMDFMDLDSLLRVLRPAVPGRLSVDEFRFVGSWPWAVDVLRGVEVCFALRGDTPCWHIYIILIFGR